jgi:hypothetical protein
MIVDRILLLIKRLIACLCIYIMGYEKSCEDLFFYSIYRALNIVRYRDERNDHKVYSIPRCLLCHMIGKAHLAKYIFQSEKLTLRFLSFSFFFWKYTSFRLLKYLLGLNIKTQWMSEYQTYKYVPEPFNKATYLCPVIEYSFTTLFRDQFVNGGLA